jgi:hypothetical protein
MRTAFFALAALVVAAGAACGSGSNGNSGFDSGTGSGSGGGDSGTDGSVGMTCTGGKTSCGTSCVDTTSDPANCGKCGVSCDGGTCCASVCVDQTASCSFSVTGVNPLEGNQNGGDWVTITGAGFVAGMRVYIGTGAAPAHVIDPQHALVLTPPLTVGTYDIKITSGAMTSILPASFMSVAGSEMPPWTEKPMKFVRGEDPGLAVLQDGRVLVAGGTTVPDSAMDALASAEIYTRMNDSVTSAPGMMTAPRIQNAAVTLLDGKVLVVGGAGWSAGVSSTNTPSVSADLFDPTSGTFAATAHPLTTARAGIRAALAWDGRVVITSGGDATADIYDPVADTFTNVPLLAMHTYGFMVRMRDGRIMLGAGDGGQTSVEIFDPAQNKFFMAPSLNQGRSMLTAHTLPDGRIMVIGGASMSAGAVDVPLSSIELYDPATNKWTVAPYSLSTGRCWHASALVSDGTVLVMGGYNVDKSCMLTAAAQIVDQVDPVAGTVKPFGTLPHPNTEWTAVTLHDGSVLGVGGGACGTPMALPSLDFLPGKPPSQ